jgi:1,4-dihydroxy-2-naphthoate octaprenyltransferase
MSRLSTDREERESQLRQYESELSGQRETRTETRAETGTRSKGRISLGQLAGAVVAVIAALWLLKHLLPLVLIIFGWAWLVIKLGLVIAAVVWLYNFFRKKR